MFAASAASGTHGSARAVYEMSFGDVEQSGHAWTHAARQAGWASHSHTVSDGAE